MRSTTIRIDSGPLLDVDIVAVGATSGLLWRSADVTLAGLGAVHRLTFGLDRAGRSISEAQAYLVDHRGDDPVGVAGTGPVGFATLPFDRSEAGVMLCPELILGESGGVRFLTAMVGQTLLEVENDVRDLLAAPLPAGPTTVSLELQRPAASWRDDVVAVARDRIQQTELQKAVFARLLMLTADSDFVLPPLVCSLAERFDHAYLFAIDGFIGASPELLVSRVDRTVRAHPLAGTAARSFDPDVDSEQIAGLLASSKDRVEHRITIEWLLTELLPFCSYVDAEPEPSVLTLANVHHLGTLVEGVLSEPAASVLELVRAVHPTPALGGDPQADAVALIAELEGFDRGRYGGPSGWVDASGNGQFAVSVRTAQVDGRSASIAAGVGVVAQSDPQAELEETQAKFRAMLGTFLR